VSKEKGSKMNKVYDNMARIIYEARVLQIMEAEEAKERTGLKPPTGLGGLAALASIVGGAGLVKSGEVERPAADPAAAAAEDPSTKGTTKSTTKGTTKSTTKGTTKGTPMWKVLGHNSKADYMKAKTKHAAQRYQR